MASKTSPGGDRAGMESQQAGGRIVLAEIAKALGTLAVVAIGGLIALVLLYGGLIFLLEGRM